MRPKTIAAGAFLTAALFLSGAVAPVQPSSSGASSALPDDAASAAASGAAHVRTARDAGDPASLPLAEAALRRSLELQPRDNLEAYVGMASLANARHDFRRSVRWARKAIATNPYNAAAYGLLGDALFELGHVRDADAAYQEMVSRRPDVASYVRASYALQHRGATRAAIGALRFALRAAGPSGETAAFVRHQLGDVYAGAGRFTRSARENRIGAAVAPGFVPPTVGIAESLIARGRLAEALPIMERAVEDLPALEYVTTLGDVYAALGRPEDARERYEDTAALLAEYRAAGVLPDADFVVFYADHGIRPAATLRGAFAIYRDRPTAKTADALAWTLHSRGRDAEAWRYARAAIAAEPRDPGAVFHAGMVARSLGKKSQAARLLREAVDADPTLRVLQPPPMRRVLDRLVP